MNFSDEETKDSENINDLNELFNNLNLDLKNLITNIGDKICKIVSSIGHKRSHAIGILDNGCYNNYSLIDSVQTNSRTYMEKLYKEFMDDIISEFNNINYEIQSEIIVYNNTCGRYNNLINDDIEILYYNINNLNDNIDNLNIKLDTYYNTCINNINNFNTKLKHTILSSK